MRALFYSFHDISLDSIVEIADERAKHLQVVRIKIGETVLLLNGQGKSAQGEIVEIHKKSVTLKIRSVFEAQKSHQFSLAIATPKKEAFEDILKIAVELGAVDIYPLTSEFSQYQYVSSERVDRILESALIQSNNAFLPTVHPQAQLDEFLQSHQSPLVFFNSRPNSAKEKIIHEKTTILIGPEGGFSPSEIKRIENYSQVKTIHLPTPIMRAPTAVAAAIGYLLSSSMS